MHHCDYFDRFIGGANVRAANRHEQNVASDIFHFGNRIRIACVIDARAVERYDITHAAVRVGMEILAVGMQIVGGHHLDWHTLHGYGIAPFNNHYVAVNFTAQHFRRDHNRLVIAYLVNVFYHEMIEMIVCDQDKVSVMQRVGNFPWVNVNFLFAG